MCLVIERRATTDKIGHGPSGVLLGQIVAVVLMLGLIGFIWSPVIDANDGLGFDGSLYAAFSADFQGTVLGGEIASYRLQRVVPAGLVALGLELTGASRTPAVLVLGWRLLNLSALVGVAILWWLIARTLCVSRAGTLMGALLLLGNFAVARMAFYYPTLTDTFALFVATWIVFAYVSDHRVMLAVASLVAAFSWPVLLGAGLLLLVFARNEEGAEPLRIKGVGRWMLIGLIGVGIAFLAVSAWTASDPDYERGYGTTLAVPWEGAKAVSIAFAVGLVVAAGTVLVRKTVPLGKAWLSRTLAGAGLAVAVLAARAWVLVAIDPVPGGGPAVGQLLDRILLEATDRPLVWLVSHIAYFGPVVILAVLTWPSVSRAAQRLGSGFVLVVGAHLFLALASESRILISFIPVLVTLVVVAYEDRGWSAAQLVGIGVVAFALSRVWLPLPTGELPGRVLEYPAQWYFSNFGPFMSDRSFVSLAVLAAGASIAITGLLPQGTRIIDSWLGANRSEAGGSGSDG